LSHSWSAIKKSHNFSTSDGPQLRLCVLWVLDTYIYRYLPIIIFFQFQIKSMMDDVTDETLPDLLIEQLASGMPCVQLLLCRLSPVIHYMQRRVKESRRGRSQEWMAWNVSDWQQIKGNAKHCSEKHYDCANMIKLNNSFR